MPQYEEEIMKLTTTFKIYRYYGDFKDPLNAFNPIKSTLTPKHAILDGSEENSRVIVMFSPGTLAARRCP